MIALTSWKIDWLCRRFRYIPILNPQFNQDKQRLTSKDNEPILKSKRTETHRTNYFVGIGVSIDNFKWWIIRYYAYLVEGKYRRWRQWLTRMPYCVLNDPKEYWKLHIARSDVCQTSSIKYVTLQNWNAYSQNSFVIWFRLTVSTNFRNFSVSTNIFLLPVIKQKTILYAFVSNVRSQLCPFKL